MTAEQEEAGLDIVEHGMYGYPEQFIPAAGRGPPFTPGVARARGDSDGVCPRPATIET